MTKITYIPGEIANAAIDEHGNRKPVTRTQHIFDDNLEKPQSEVNQDRIEDVATLDGKIDLEKQRAEGIESGLNNRLGTVEQLAEISIGGGDAQIATGADFTNPDATKRAKIPTVGAIVDGLNDGIYDVSKRNPSAGPNSDGKFTLDYILGNADTLIPTGWRHGGMTISFVQSSDNKYIQYRLMNQTFSTTVADWQGVDDKPTTGSKNLVTSNGVSRKISEITQTPEYNLGYINTAGEVKASTSYHYSDPIKVFKGQIITIDSIGSVTGTATLSVYNNGVYTPLYVSTDAISIKYIVKEDCNIVVCKPIAGTASISSVTYVQQVEIEKDIPIQKTAIKHKVTRNISNNQNSTLNNIPKTKGGDVIQFYGNISGGNGIEIILLNDNIEQGRFCKLSGNDFSIQIPKCIEQIDAIQIWNYTGSSISIVDPVFYLNTDYEELSVVSDNGSVNSLIKELYIPADIYETLNLSSIHTLRVTKGALSGGNYYAGIMFNNGLSVTYCSVFSSLEELSSADLSIVGRGGVQAVIDFDKLELGTVSEYYVCKINENVQNAAFSPLLFTKSLPIDNIPTAGSNNPVKSGGVFTFTNNTVNQICDSKIFNVSKRYPTGGINGSMYYDIETAVSKVTQDIATSGMILMFRVPLSEVKSGFYLRYYVLDGVTAGTADVWYHNIDNYKEIVLKYDTIDISYTYPKGGANGDDRYELPQAVVKVPSPIRYHGLKIRFNNSFGNSETWEFLGYTNYDFEHMVPLKWKRVDFDFEYLSDCQNRLANPIYTTIEKYNIEHPSSPIDAITVHPLNNSDGDMRRIPTCIITNAGTYLTATQKQTNEQGDFGEFSIEVSRKTVNGEWTSSVVVPFISETITWRCNTSFLVERDNSQGHQGRIYLFFGSFRGVAIWWEQTTESSDFNYVYSDDDGVTWSAIQSLKSEWDTDAYAFVIPSCTNGIQLENGTLVVPCMSRLNTELQVSRSLLLYKTTSGNWTFSSVVPNTTNAQIDECTVVEKKGKPVLVIRNNNPQDYVKYNRTLEYDVSNDRWNELLCTFNQHRSCCMSIDKFNHNDKDIFIMSAIDSYDGNSRVNVTIWASLDLDKWIRVYRAYKPSGNGYSVVSTYNDKFILVYETSSKIEFQDISGIKDIIVQSSNYINYSVEDRIQILFNKAVGID